MDTPDNKTTLKVLGALLLLLLLVGLGIPGMLYLAIGMWAAVYGWYAVVFTGASMGLLSYLLSDHDEPPPPRVRRVDRIT